MIMQRDTGAESGRSARPATPHDNYFRYVFQQPEPAHDLVLNVLRLEPGVAFGAGDADGAANAPDPDGATGQGAPAGAVVPLGVTDPAGLVVRVGAAIAWRSSTASATWYSTWNWE
ncbi:MAG: hypothetical protein EA427_16375 [Spirochaetaceae bacterium]|nr:MAG: hypothetical protein EA427_16375 [Spirochaetaceae bacterium]